MNAKIAHNKSKTVTAKLKKFRFSTQRKIRVFDPDIVIQKSVNYDYYLHVKQPILWNYEYFHHTVRKPQPYE